MNGCVAAISVDTGKVLDIEVMSSYCPPCKRLQTMPRNFEYESSKADHICQCNFTGSASKMEIVGASRIFLRSEKNRRLQYTQYYGDGDSKAFMTVKDTNGLNGVTKFECIGHVQKRVGSRLRKLKTKNKGLSGKGKLTDNFIDRLQNYYRIAVRSNVGNLTAMQQNVIAALYHCASSDKKPIYETHKVIKYAFTGKIQVNSKNFLRRCSATLSEHASQAVEIVNGACGVDTVTANYLQFWFHRFRSGLFDVKVAPHTDRPVLENVDKIIEIIEVDRYVSSRSIAPERNIDHKTVLNHLRKVGFQKKFDVWCHTN
ncbi:uncharacterized protein TNCV_3005711 [Trichonephila clavipes]|nr:uncharacterized protein TNCV_3005711 [Trichonephila clavipes]